jgi:hypothetical protein
MKKSLVPAIMLILAAFLRAPAVHAEAPGLLVNPLQYEDTLTTSKVKLGFIEVANPSDTTINLQSRVQAFHQEGDEGKLVFADDPDIQAGITVDLKDFSLGPREAIRVAFNVDPAKLPRGGVYAVIFFRTIPPAQNSNSSYVSESANIGTLLILQNGPAGAHTGQIKQYHLPFLQFGSGITGQLTYANTDRSKAPVGFKPALTARAFPWGKPQKQTSGLVLPRSERKFAVNRPGAYLGLIPLTVTDTESGSHRTAWVFAVTGWWRVALPVILLILIFAALITKRRRRKSQPQA